jgi:hypothetical protein
MTADPDPPADRGPMTWAVLLLVWAAGLVSWAVWLAAIVYVLARVFFRDTAS